MIGREGQGKKQFISPQGVVLDMEGNIIVSEGGPHSRVQILRPDGTFLSSIGRLGRKDKEFIRPSGVCVTPDGQIAVVDFGNNRIVFF